MQVVANRSDIRIDKYLSDILPLSRSLIAKMIASGDILVDGHPCKNNYLLKVGENIFISDDYNQPIDIKAEDIPLDIVYEDEDVIVINKKSGMVVHPGNGNYEHTLVNALLNHTANLSDVNGRVRPGIIHRIDKDTSGLMLVAKNNFAHQFLASALEHHEIKRDYIALLKGELMTDTATVDAPIGRDKTNRLKMAVTKENAKEAITHLRVIKRYVGYTLVRLSLETGRTHQIRVHMSYIGYPVYNDPVYTNDSCTEFGQFLHSTSLDFTHPRTHEHMHFEVPVPEEFANFLNTLTIK